MTRHGRKHTGVTHKRVTAVHNTTTLKLMQLNRIKLLLILLLTLNCDISASLKKAWCVSDIIKDKKVFT